MDSDRISVLDKGYVRYIDHMGGKLRTVNAAKASFQKESVEFGEKEARLHAFLEEEEHTSPTRHSVITFEVYAPLFVARQWYKHVVGSMHGEVGTGETDPFFAWNESSRRYVTEEPEFYFPEWRGKPENNKQGSTDERPNLPDWFDAAYQHQIDRGVMHYEYAINAGVAPEQARLFLPAYPMYVRWYWTASYQAVQHFLRLREEHSAQYEIREYANAVSSIFKEKFEL